MGHTRRRKRYKEDMSKGELAWLTGENVHELNEADNFMYWCLTVGDCSHFKGKTRSPRYLSEQWAALIPDERWPFIKKCIRLYDEKLKAKNKTDDDNVNKDRD